MFIYTSYSYSYANSLLLPYMYNITHTESIKLIHVLCFRIGMQLELMERGAMLQVESMVTGTLVSEETSSLLQRGHVHADVFVERIDREPSSTSAHHNLYRFHPRRPPAQTLTRLLRFDGVDPRATGELRRRLCECREPNYIIELLAHVDLDPGDGDSDLCSVPAAANATAEQSVRTELNIFVRYYL